MSPQRPMSTEFSYGPDDDMGDGQARSIHSLEKRKINHPDGDNDNESVGSIHIDSTLSPSPEMKFQRVDPLKKQVFMKRMNSTNIDSNEVSPHESEKKPSKLARMESYEVGIKPHEYSMRKSPEKMPKATLSPDISKGRLASPTNNSPKNKPAPKSLLKTMQFSSKK